MPLHFWDTTRRYAAIVLLSTGLISSLALSNLRTRSLAVQAQPTVLLQLAQSQPSEPRRAEADQLAQQAIEQAKKGNLDRVLRILEQALKFCREVQDRQCEGNVLSAMGFVAFSLKDHFLAIDYLQQGLLIAQKTKDQKGEYEQLWLLALSSELVRDYPAAINYSQQRLAIARKIKDRDSEGFAMRLLGSVYRKQGDYSKAMNYFEQSLTIAREVKNRHIEGLSLQGIGLTSYFLRDYSQAMDYLKQWLILSNRHPIALNDLGEFYFKTGELAKAEPLLFEAIEKLELDRQKKTDSQKVFITDLYRNPYDTLQQVLIAQHKVEAALEVSERGRARAFAELLAERTQEIEHPPIPLISIASIRQIAREQNATLIEYSKIGDNNFWIDNDLINNQQLLIWVVKPTGEVAFRQVDLKPLEQEKTSLDNLITAARCLGVATCEEAIASRGSEFITFNIAQGDRQFGKLPAISIKNEYLKRLHQLLIDPIADLLPTHPTDRIIFIPQGKLFLLPFAALQDQKGTYLIEKHTISIAPSIQILQLTHQKRQRQATANFSNVLLVGNPTMPRVIYRLGEPPATLVPLPGAEREAKAISRLLKVPVLIGPQATKAAVLQRISSARIIHLATHGLLDDPVGQGVPGAIALASNSLHPNDGLLTANELLKLKLKAELVVLSACNTGRGRITGDGVIGLSRALITAGVPSVVASLWAIPDGSTAEFMLHFYRNLKVGQDKAQALRQAMLDTKKQHPDPINWAAFVLIGQAQ